MLEIVWILNKGSRVASQLKDSAAHTKDALGAKFEKNKAEAKDTFSSGHNPDLLAKKEAAKGQEKASLSAAKDHAGVVSCGLNLL